jgi:type II secretory pathway pseudopilin PulG
MVVVTIMAIMIAIPAPHLLRAIEQSKLDTAVSNLRSIWCAQRFYYLQQQGSVPGYATLPQLAPPPSGIGLIDGSLLTPSANTYSYAITTTSAGFTAFATPPTSNASYGGWITIDQDGTLDFSNLTFGGVAMTPSPTLAP